MEQVRASHILVETKEQADALFKQLQEGASFEQLAMQHSRCPSSAKGGDLGMFGRGRMVQPFEIASFSLELGGISTPIQTQFGYHLIKRTA